MTQEEKYMKAAIREAKKAYALEEVPIGCVIVQNSHHCAGLQQKKYRGKYAGARGAYCDQKGEQKDRRLAAGRLHTMLNMSLKPCQMCAGAIVQSRMKKVVIGSMNPKAGCAGSVLNLLQMAQFNHQVEIERGVLEEECSTMLSGFFRELRDKKKRLRENV